MLAVLKEELSAPFEAFPMEVAVLRLLAAVTLGGLIGFEREMKEKPAGLRTHMMVALAACLFTLMAFEMVQVEAKGSGASIQADPIRAIEAVTAGVAFLAAGTIFSQRGRVNGLTTGASMWLAGAVGLACGAGRIPLAALATLVTLIVLWLVHLASRRIGAVERGDRA
ncbi:MgtC/SapB family protein [Haematobacter genomosp. 1]|uniref:Protein MgtC n=1 Tax=Haematobacter genomosp. 1 TaxID=366618 RepID=A0A212AF00_9RHOB|nr:MgtC/SapB family protein [Haematobacter genomosp. 1]OWJ79995.1 MgtC/SapB transporter [Haematobacter genomosp. 1]